MIVVYNENSTQSKYVPKLFKESHGISDIEKEPIRYVDNEQYILIGFIYKEGKFDYFKNKNTYFITNIGTLPQGFNTVGEDKKHYSIIHQLLYLGLLEGSKELKRVALDHDNYFNFLEYNQSIQSFISDYNPIKLDELIEKCYYSNIGDKHIYLLYENDPKLKLLLAHEVLKNTSGLFITVSQTRSNNDILTIYMKDVDKAKLCKIFNLDYTPHSNIISMFIPSHINVLGNQLKKFLEENNEV